MTQITIQHLMLPLSLLPSVQFLSWASYLKSLASPVKDEPQESHSVSGMSILRT
ncbi:MAG: hypothetical protein ETSY2_43990 [Candidatus Entotheonella gemina]|uniref:Uncharacterized protein n=1 Tax=Candidatus Entotheonella gemina TaxID=1429439 RepID=W4LJ77_9BACT|nr:MAG: hypothetical protein ETSY2_43990 [Candidatus Entotheonella gemina]